MDNVKPAMRVAIVSHPRHVDVCLAEWTNDMMIGNKPYILATEWRAYEYAKGLGFDATVLSFFGEFMSPPSQTINSLYNLACDWVYHDRKDVTLYRNVSVGHLVGTQLAIARHELAGYFDALNVAIAKLAPKSIELFDLSSAFHFLGPATKRALVQHFVDVSQCQLYNRLDVPDPDDAAFNLLDVHRQSADPNQKNGRTILRSTYAHLVELLTRARHLFFRRRPRVLFYISQLSTLEMLTVLETSSAITPVFLAETLPKSWTFLRSAIIQGVLLSASQTSDKIHASRDARILADRIRQLPKPQDPLDAVFRIHIEEYLGINETDAPRLVNLVDMIDRVDALFGRHKIEGVVLGDVSNSMCRCLCMLAKARGLKTFETLNGMFVAKIADPTRQGDIVRDGMLDWFLAFGEASRDWFMSLGGPARVIVTGYPALDTRRALGDQRWAKRPSSGTIPEKLVILPPYAWISDPGTDRADTITAVLSLVTGALAVGVKSVRLKLHPAIENPRFFEQTFKRHGLSCDVYASGSIDAHLEWADAVVGPVTTSVFLEALASGVPYYVYHPKRSAIPLDDLHPCCVVQSGKDLMNIFEEGTEPDREAILNRFAAWQRHPSASKAVWLALNNAFDRSQSSQKEPVT